MTKKPKNTNEEDIVLEPSEEEAGDENILAKVRELRDKLKECQKTRDEYLSGWQRAKADYVNSSKENEARLRGVEEIIYAKVISDIIPVLDSFEMAFANKEAWNSTPENWRNGIEYIKNQLNKALESYGLKEICPKPKDNVNFEYHNVVESVISDKNEDEGLISEVLQKGYSVNDRVIRPARVKVFVKK